MSFESESSLEPGVICSVGGTSGNGLFLVSEPSGFSTKSQRSVNLTEEANMVETRPRRLGRWKKTKEAAGDWASVASAATGGRFGSWRRRGPAGFA
ncbi:hypothetical protein D5086_003933 [Populus alba]|uniref:Uncharacterized protein n=1 Tax=Populus alba TaxID=43335 RepID=A0ACC4D688_POPAL